jgi:hypothetical protein
LRKLRRVKAALKKGGTLDSSGKHAAILAAEASLARGSDGLLLHLIWFNYSSFDLTTNNHLVMVSPWRLNRITVSRPMPIRRAWRLLRKWSAGRAIDLEPYQTFEG